MVFPVVVLFLRTRRSAWCLVSGEEDRRSWRASLVSGVRRRLMKKVLLLSGNVTVEKPVRFLELLLKKEDKKE